MNRPAGGVRALRAPLAGLCALLLAAGCAPSTDVATSFTDLGWSERLRPDLNALDPAQRTQLLAQFSDGGAAGDRLVSPLYPETAEVAAGQMPAAPVLWIRQGTPLRLSYETVAYNPLLNGARPDTTETAYGSTVASQPVQAKQGAVSGRGLTVPIDRQFLVVPGLGTRGIMSGNLVQADLGVGALLGVALEACTDGQSRFDPADPPLRLDRRCTRRLITPDFCAGAAYGASFIPATVLRCPVVANTDTSYRLRVVDASDPNRVGTAVVRNTRQPPLELLPNVKVVTQPRVLLRQAGFLREECKAPDISGGERDCNQAELADLRLWRHCNGTPQTLPAGVTFGACPLAWPSQPGLSPPGFAAITGLWSFSVGDPASGEFRENFASGIGLRRVKFVHTSEARPNLRRYLRPPGAPAGADDLVELRMVLTPPGQSQLPGAACAVTAEPGTGDAVADSASCPDLFRRAVNPAWAAGLPMIPIEWRLVLRESAETVQVGQICHPNCVPFSLHDVLRRDLRYRPEAGDRLFLEFLVE